MKLWKVTILDELPTFARDSKENVYNSFGKGCDTSLALNFGISAGENCDPGCRMHPESTSPDKIGGCYATTIEKQRPAVVDNLAHKEDIGALKVIALAIVQWGELQVLIRENALRQVSWVRISSGGSVPAEDQVPVRYRKRYKALFRQLVQLWTSVGAMVHFPVESIEKAVWYRSFLGDLITIRLSAQSEGEFYGDNGAMSFVVGEHITSKNSKRVKRDRVTYARAYARERKQETGRPTMHCGAIESTFLKREYKQKCGICKACAMDDIDILYSKHN